MLTFLPNEVRMYVNVRTWIRLIGVCENLRFMCFVQGTLPSRKIPCQAPKSLKPEYEDLEPTHDAALSLINKLTSVWMLVKHVVVIHIPSKTVVKWINVCFPAKQSYIFAFFRQAEASAK